MKTFYKNLITASLLISLFVFLCGCGISGEVTGDVQSGVKITLSGDTSDNTTTDANGSYIFEGLSNGSYTVTPSLTGYTFSPASQNITVPGDDTKTVDFKALAKEIEQVEFFSDHRVNSIIDTDLHVMLGFVLTDSMDFDTCLYVPTLESDPLLMKYPYWTPYYPNQYILYRSPENGFPEPGPDWEDIEFLFYIDKNSNRSFDEGIDPGETIPIASGALKKLGVVQNIEITSGAQPTFSWQPTQDNTEAYYRIRLFPLADDEDGIDIRTLLFQTDAITADDSDTYSYIYGGNLFEETNELCVVIEAYETNAEDKIINRSQYYFSHNTAE